MTASWPVPINFPDVPAWIGREFAIDVAQRRLFPWIAVSFGLGIVLFFQAEEPALWAPLVCFVLSLMAAWFARRSLPALALLIGLAALSAGFAAGVVRTRSVAGPVLTRITIAAVSGFVETVEDRGQDRRILLRLVSLQGMAASDLPKFVRVNARKGEGLAPGQFIEAKARLLPPPQPAWPGGYDFARDARFREVGAVGSLLGAPKIIAPPQGTPWFLAVTAGIDAARNALTQRIASAIGGPAGGVSAALVTGKRGLIGEPTNDVLRAAGIYHIVSISGLHMVLAAGTFFWLIRAFLALFPIVALRWPVKKIAAVAAMFGATAYGLFTGSDVATERSLIMTLVMFGAVLADRPALSIRNLSVSALLVLAREPEALLGPSFQMSFGAVAALTAFAPLLTLKPSQGQPVTALGRALHWSFHQIWGLFATTLIASLATAPFSAYHFQTINPYGLIGNALALPLVSVVVMPAAVLGVLTYPFGLDRPIWQVMGLAVNQVLDVSAWVGSFSGATMVMPALSILAFGFLSAALLILTVPASSFRWLAVLPIGAGLATAAPIRYDVFIDREAAGAAIRDASGTLTVVGKPSAFVTEQWLRADGDGRNADDGGLRRQARCDRSGCVVEGPEQRSIAFVQDVSAFEEDCRRAVVILTRLKAPTRCEAGLVLDRDALASRGATVLRFRDRDTIEVRSVRKGSEVIALRRASTDDAAATILPNRPMEKRPVPEQDLPDEEISSDERD
ncbi:ComEC/Rec2 family competence protein [Microvirga puerhi]|uniref:ComEC family competence protein n=1 Tax=Microvirga puerhi TaxID=2876078 RepID=A0ABS7VNZ9_9HYPH|nr:ComEC/Rec2 family competence protein [Microvirga puerhi]MBZ6076929.1 ComEC family competence protein [Microvirga puerhi]